MKEKIGLVLFFVIGYASLASAQYTTKKIAAVDPADDSGRVHVVVVFTGQGVKDAKRDYFPTDMDAFKAAVAADLRDLNQKQTSTKTLIVGADVAAPNDPPTPTEDDLTVTAFQTLVKQWRVERGKLLLGAGSQDAVDQAAAAVAAAYAAAKSAAVRTRFDDLILVYTLAGV